MANTVPVSVGWALWGKRPGTSQDYSVLASSAEPLSEQEFASVLTHFVPGTPPTEPGRPDSLPWVTLSRVGVAQQVYLGISIENATDTVDGTGRPITSTSYFCIPYAEVRATPVSYVALCRQLAEVDLPYQGGSLIHLAVPRLDPQAVAADIIRDFGEAEVTAAAAMVLSGTVSIVGSEGTTLDGRLRFLDAVAALLPYGYRAGYTASTWSDSGTLHPIRIAFASRPRQDAAALRWGGPPPAAVDGAAGGAYLRLLRQVREQLPGEDHLAALISALAGDAVPCNFDQSQRAIDGLRAFALPFLVREAVRNGTADPADVRDVFLRSRDRDLAPSERQGLFGWLIATADRQPKNWDVIRDCWDRVADGQPLAMLPTLIQAVRDRLWTPSPSLSIGEYFTLAIGRHIIDPLLAGLVAAPDSRSDFLGGRGAVAQQVANRVLGEPGPAALPQTRQALAGNLLVACELLTQLAGNERELQTVLDWLDPVLPAPLAPFHIVFGRARAEVSEAAIQQLAERDPEFAALLLTAASDRGRLDRVLPGFARYLARNAVATGPPSEESVHYWRTRIVAVKPGGPDTAAWLDLALLAAGNDPCFMLERRDQQSREQYTKRLVHSWLTLVAELGLAVDEALAGPLVRYLRRERWWADAAPAIVVTEVVRQLTRGDHSSPLWVATAEELSRAPQAEIWRFAEDFRLPGRPNRRSADEPGRRVAAGQPAPWEARGAQSPPEQDWRPLTSRDRGPTLAALHNLRRGAAAVDIANAVTEAFRDDLRLEDVGRAVAESRAIQSGAQALDTLHELHRALLDTPGRPPKVEAWLAWFARGFAGGTFGDWVADEFRSRAIQSSFGEIGYHVGVLHIAAAGRDQGSIDKLIRALNAVEDSLRGGGKRPGRRGIHLWGRGEPE